METKDIKNQKPQIKGNNNKGKPKKIFEFRVNFSFKNIILWILIILVGLSFLNPFLAPSNINQNKPLTEILNDIKEKKVKKVEVEEEKITAHYKDNKIYSSRKETDNSFIDILKASNIDPKSVEVTVKEAIFGNIWMILGNVLPLLLMVGFFIFIFRQARGAQDSIFSFGASKAKLFDKGKQKITFADVAGVDEAKKELEEIVDFLKHPAKYQALGARTPKGVLLVGPSGTGKTLLAKAIAGEANVPFFSMAGSEFMEMLVGVGASVSGDTPVLIKENNNINLIPIEQFVDHYYEKSETDVIKKVTGIETLGFDKEQNKFWGTKSLKSKRAVFAKSSWQNVYAVYRHKANKIYEIEFLDGKIKTTGDHSVFIRTHGAIMPKRVDQLKAGDLLVNLPLNIRHWDSKKRKTIHQIKAHDFPKNISDRYLDFWNEDQELQKKYQYALSNQGILSSYAIADEIGVCQTTVLNWQNEIHTPQLLSRKLVKLDLPERVLVSPELCRLFGLFTAEGRGTGDLEFTFGKKETDLHKETIRLIRDVFGISPSKAFAREDNSFKIIYYSHHLGRFFSRFCGNGSHNKHLPNFLWNYPKEYFLAFLEGWSKGDGYITKSGKLSVTSVSHKLITEVAWLCSMHGIKVGIKHGENKAGRIIKEGMKPLPAGKYWSLIIGKTSNPFTKETIKWPFQIKRAIVKKIKELPFNGFVYDLCGVQNEAFFGGEKPILLHNSRVRDLFSTAKKAAPSIIFIDEIESIGRTRSMIGMSSHDEREQTLNQILVEMDGFTPNENIIIVGASNRPDLLDPALVRPGRFDRRVALDLPDIEGRKAILKIHMRGKPFDPAVDWDKMAKRTVGFSGADLENMLNEAAILAARLSKKAIDMSDLEEAATKVKLGPEKKRLQSDLDRKMTAYHEAGHGVATFLLPTMDPVHRISIVSRGLALGYTLIPPAKDRYNETRSRLVEQISSLLGGRAAEEVEFKEFTAGASSDIKRATEVARDMVISLGMSDLGPINFGPQMETTEYGKFFSESNQISPEMQAKIDGEVKKIIDKAYTITLDLLKKNKKKLDLVAEALIKKETIEGDEFKAIMEGK